MKPLYRVKDWFANFETSDSKRRLKSLPWVALPTKHDGKGFRRVMRETGGMSIYGAWVLIVAVAAKSPLAELRGMLIDYDGPLDAEDIADKTGADPAEIQRALDLLSSERIGWLEIIDTDIASRVVKSAVIAGQRTNSTASELVEAKAFLFSLSGRPESHEDDGEGSDPPSTDADTPPPQSSDETPVNPDAVDLMVAWNAIEGVPHVNEMTAKRQRSVATRMRDPKFRDTWRDAIKKVATSDFLKASSTGWKASLDWFLKPDSFIKILEGAYDNASSTNRRNGGTIDLGAGQVYSGG